VPFKRAEAHSNVGGSKNPGSVSCPRRRFGAPLLPLERRRDGSIFDLFTASFLVLLLDQPHPAPPRIPPCPRGQVGEGIAPLLMHGKQYAIEEQKSKGCDDATLLVAPEFRLRRATCRHGENHADWLLQIALADMRQPMERYLGLGSTLDGASRPVSPCALLPGWPWTHPPHLTARASLTPRRPSIGGPSNHAPRQFVTLFWLPPAKAWPLNRNHETLRLAKQPASQGKYDAVQ